MKEKENGYSREEFIKTGLKGLTFTLVAPIFFSPVVYGNTSSGPKKGLVFSGPSDNDLLLLLKRNGINASRVKTPQEAIEKADFGDGIVITATDYPYSKVKLPKYFYKKIKKKDVRLFIEYPELIPGNIEMGRPTKNDLKRGVITSNFFSNELPEMSLLGLHECYYCPVKIDKSLISFAKVAGFDRAKYGLTNTDVFPLLFKSENIIVSVTSFTTFKQARYRPNDSWKTVWENILRWLMNAKDFKLCKWESDPRPSYDKYNKLPVDARCESIIKGTQWIFNGRFLIHTSWKDMVLKYQNGGQQPFGPPISSRHLVGDGTSGILEGQASVINYDGSQQYRYWIRCDAQGGGALMLAAGQFLTNSKFKSASENLLDYVFYTSDFRQGPRNDKDSSVFGLLGWGDKQMGVFYSDDNARAVLSMLGASSFLNNQRWNKFMLENILANFRLTSKQGFFGNRLGQKQILENGWQWFHDRDYVNLNPHFEAWPWACYLWLYDKTGYRSLLDKTKTAIRITMEGYPDKWEWQNGMQQERARMILPLAWLVRVENSLQHRKWLNFMTDEVLKYQQPSGAIREELGRPGAGLAGGPKSNKEYGKAEAPLIAKDGDPVSDMLYTCNFAFFGLNEAAHTIDEKKYVKAANKLSNFLTRIQVKSDIHQALDGTWFRAFDYNQWDYWASNADNGWGAWSTEIGWTQAWIITTQVLLEQNTSFWELTKHSNIDQYMDQSVKLMLKK